MCDVFIDPGSDFNGGLAKPPLKLGQGFVITENDVILFVCKT